MSQMRRIFAKEITKESAGIKIAVTVFAVIHARIQTAQK